MAIPRLLTRFWRLLIIIAWCFCVLNWLWSFGGYWDFTWHSEGITAHWRGADGRIVDNDQYTIVHGAYSNRGNLVIALSYDGFSDRLDGIGPYTTTKFSRGLNFNCDFELPKLSEYELPAAQDFCDTSAHKGFYWHGFAFGWVKSPYIAQGFAVPWWALTTVASISPIWMCARWWRKRRRFPPGACVQCGYDLRESPNRCPECGTCVARTDR